MGDQSRRVPLNILPCSNRTISSCLRLGLSRISDFFYSVEQRIDRLYREHTFFISTVFPIICMAIRTALLELESDDSEFNMDTIQHVMGSPLFFCTVTVLGGASAHVVSESILLFVWGAFAEEDSVFRLRAAKTSVFPVLIGGIVGLNIVTFSFCLHFGSMFDSSLRAHVTKDDYFSYHHFSCIAFLVIFCFNRLLAFYSMPALYPASTTCILIVLICIAFPLEYVPNNENDGSYSTIITTVVITIRICVMVCILFKNLLCFWIMAKRWDLLPSPCIKAPSFYMVDWNSGNNNKNVDSHKYELDRDRGGEGGSEGDLEPYPYTRSRSNQFDDSLSPTGAIGGFGLSDLETPGDMEDPDKILMSNSMKSAGSDGSFAASLNKIPSETKMASTKSQIHSVTSYEAPSSHMKHYRTPQDVIALFVAITTTLNSFFILFLFPLASSSPATGTDGNFSIRVFASVLNAAFFVVVQYRLAMVYVHEVDIDFMKYQRVQRDVNKDLNMLLACILPSDIKERMTERMMALLRGDSTREVRISGAGDVSDEAEMAIEPHTEDIEILFSDISLSRQTRDSSVIGACMSSTIPMITSDSIIYRFNASKLETVRLTP